MLHLNQTAAVLLDAVLDRPERYRVSARDVPGGGQLVDFGIESPGGLQAGLALAAISMGGLADVTLSPGPIVSVRTDHPVAACLGSQYAGWKIQQGKFFALGSGPMRALAGREPLYDQIGGREKASVGVGVLETNHFPGPEVLAYLSEAIGLPAKALRLCVAPVTSLAGATQIVARALETALHKLHELHFDLSRIQAGYGSAPLPPTGGEWLTAMGRTNDAILYGGQVTLWVRGDDASLQEIGPRIPSSSSSDYGLPFRQLFERYDCEFYKIDPLLFSPAQVTLLNIDTGRTFRFGQTHSELLRQSFEN